MAARTFFRMWLTQLVFFPAFAVVVGIVWGLGRLFDIYAIPNWIGIIVVVLFGSAFSTWFMTSELVKRAILAMMKWVEQ